MRAVINCIPHTEVQKLRFVAAIVTCKPGQDCELKKIVLLARESAGGSLSAREGGENG